MMIKGNINSFESMGLVDGPGVRFVVFLQGCPLRCAYCHNPEMWNAGEEKITLTPRELVDKIKRYRIYFKNHGGVTMSGGEPLMQEKFVTEVFRLCKKEGIHTCLDTSGYGEASDELLKYTDLVLLDVKELDPEKYEGLVAQKIDKFYKFVEKCQKKRKKLWIRQVILPNYNDNKESVLKLKAFVDTLKYVEKVELLPYHNMAEKKYASLGIKYRLAGLPSMDEKKCKSLEKYLR